MEDVAEFQWRLSTPLSALLLALLAIPLSRSKPRQGRYARMLAALVIYAVYFNLLDVGRTWVELGERGRISGGSPVVLALLVLVLYLPWGKTARKLSGALGVRSMKILDRYIVINYLMGIIPVLFLLLALFSFVALADELEECR